MEKFDLENFPTSESAKKMMSYVSGGFYDKSYVGKWLYQVMGTEYDKALEIVEDLPAQFFPETATWGLAFHEIKWGLPVRLNLRYEERRRMIYQKRDCRAPMIPYRMEKYLEDATGFEVHIADVHDPGEYGFNPPHPNVFKAYFLGQETLNSELIHEKLDRLKQSHTTYIVNDRIEVTVDDSKLEKFGLINIKFHIPVSFWNVKMYDGTFFYDGTFSYDSKRRYGLRLGLKQMYGIYNRGEIRMESAVFLMQAIMQKYMGAGLLYRFAIGSRNILSAIIRERARLSLAAEVEEPAEEISNVTVVTKRNVLFYDGTAKYEGSDTYNSLYRKETIK